MVRLLLALYPRAWRERYGAEFEELLEQLDLRPGDLAGVVVQAGAAHLRLRARGLQQSVALVLFAIAEYTAVVSGYTVNIFWTPEALGSALLLLVSVGSLALAMGPVLARTARRMTAVVRRRLGVR